MTKPVAGALLLAIVMTLPATEDAAWAQGRPAEALPVLLATARNGHAWNQWYDAGLCAAAAGERGRAAACLLAARRTAPERPEPKATLAVLGIDQPILWTDRLGPLSMPGSGWPAVVLAAIAGLALGGFITARRRSGWWLVVGLVAFLALAPGQVAVWRDHDDPHRTTLRDTQLLDATGAPVAPLAAGTVIELLPGEPWAGRIAVRLVDGRAGFLPIGDTD